MWGFHATALHRPISLPQCARGKQLQTQGGHQRTRQHHHPILPAFGIAHDDHMAVKVHVFDAKAHALHQSHASAVEQSGYQCSLTVHLRQQPGDLVFGQYAGYAPLLGRAVDAIEPGQFNSENFPVKEQDGTQCLIVSRCRHLAVGGQPCVLLCVPTQSDL